LRIYRPACDLYLFGLVRNEWTRIMPAPGVCLL
jgi:hypothetical protein